MEKCQTLSLSKKILSISNLSLFESETIFSRRIISEKKKLLLGIYAWRLSGHLSFNGQQKSSVARLTETPGYVNLSEISAQTSLMYDHVIVILYIVCLGTGYAFFNEKKNCRSPIAYFTNSFTIFLQDNNLFKGITLFIINTWNQRMNLNAIRHQHVKSIVHAGLSLYPQIKFWHFCCRNNNRNSNFFQAEFNRDIN